MTEKSEDQYEVRSACYGGMLMENPEMHMIIRKPLQYELEEEAQLQAMYLAMILSQQRTSMMPFYALIFIEVLMILTVLFIRFF